MIEIISKALSDLVPYDKNPRKISQAAIDAVAESIQEFGFKNPILIDKNNVIIAGHTRRLAAQKLGLERVPCVLVDDLTPQQIKALRLADNKTNELADWDIGELDIELADLLDMDMERFGFELPELDEPTEVVEDEIPEEVETRSKLGEIWKLGNHRLMCGDSTDPKDVDSLMNGDKSDISFTSPPYNVGDSAKITGNTHMTDCKYRNGKDDLSDYDELLSKSTDIMLDNSDYVFINLQMLANNKQTIIEWLYNKKTYLCDIAIWYKNSTAPAFAEKVMNSQFEFIFIFSKRNNSKAIGTKDFRGTVSNVYQGSAQRNNEYSEIHSATFPVEFVSHFISNFTKQSDSVLDCFGGTGTTLIACEQLKRKCYTMELDPHYCDVIIARWENLTGRKAELMERASEAK